VAEVPFDSEFKFMATFHEMTRPDGRPVVRCYVKGAPDVLIARGGSYRSPDGTTVPVTDANRHLALEANDRMANSGERVMVVAQRDFDPATFDRSGDLLGLVSDLTLLAMVGIVDPPRPEAKVAIAECHSAGICRRRQGRRLHGFGAHQVSEGEQAMLDRVRTAVAG
jgi:Ca2+-transporting ATPase